MNRGSFEKMEDLRGRLGEEAGVSDWQDISPGRVRGFAEVTGDSQWIHLDSDRCVEESPFGVPVAHGYLTLSLFPILYAEAVEIRDPFRLVVNYGIDRLRFPAPVPVGSRIRLRLTPLSVDDIPDGVQVVWKATFEVEGNAKPACTAEIVFRYYR